MKKSILLLCMLACSGADTASEAMNGETLVLEAVTLEAPSFESENRKLATRRTEFDIADGEYWWGAVVAYGARMPYMAPVAEYDLTHGNNNNQLSPLLLSNRGRYVWSDAPFTFSINEGVITITSTFEAVAPRQAADATLRGAYLEACRKHFPPSGTVPDKLFFTMPQYNTWIELIYDQNEADILKYADDVLANDLPVGIFMIDDNWQKYYGNFDFKPDKFPDPRGMVERLHALGFRVMLWVSPFVSPDSPEYRDLAAKGYLVREKGGSEPAVISWWNGHSAAYDLTNPDAAAYLVAHLKEVQIKYGVDGFKFDGGDNIFYQPSVVDSYKADATAVDHTEAWARLGLEFPLNEYRAGWKMGGEALVQRLGDKVHSWDAVRSLVPEMTAAGLLGYWYSCPDMIGGGSFGSFLDKTPDELDHRLIVRSAQVHAMMPMMQFSVAPWRVLSAENLAIVREAALLHERMGDYIVSLAEHASRTGEPIVRHMEYSFPSEGFATCRDQFMLGDRYLVAPVITPDDSRQVKLPRGKWRAADGRILRGGRTITVDAPLDTLPYFERVE